MAEAPVEIQHLGQSVIERFDDMNRRINEAATQVQRLQGSGGLIEPLSNLVGYDQIGLDTVDPSLMVASVEGVSFVGQAQLLLAGDGITFTQPDNTPYLRISAAGGSSLCYDAVVNPDGTGTHLTLAAAIVTAIAASGNNFTILVCVDITLAGVIDLGGINKTIMITGLVPPALRVLSNSATADRGAASVITAALNSHMFTQTTAKSGNDRGVIFTNLGLMMVSGKSIFHVDVTSEMDSLEFDNCYFNSVTGRGFLVTNGLDVLMPLGNLDLLVNNCSGVLDAFFENNSGTLNFLHAQNNNLDLTKWWTTSTSPDFCVIEGGYYIVTEAQTITLSGNFKRWTFKSLTIQTGCFGAAFRHDATDSNHSGVHYSNILFISTHADTNFGDFQGPSSNAQFNLYIVDIHGVVSTAVVPTGTFLTVDSDQSSPYISNIWAPNWSPVYSGPTITPSVPPVLDHGVLTGLADDDHTAYIRHNVGRATPNIVIGGTASGADLTLQSTSHGTRGSVFMGGTKFEFDEATGQLKLDNGGMILGPEAAIQFVAAGTNWTPSGEMGIGEWFTTLLLQGLNGMYFVIDPADTAVRSFFWYHGGDTNTGTLIMDLPETGQLRLPITGSGGGLIIGTNSHLYNVADKELTIDSRVLIDGTLTTAGKPVFAVDAFQNSVGRAMIESHIDSDGVDTLLFRLVDDGELQLPKATVSGQGLTLGGDVELYRSSANVLRTPDSLIVDTDLTVSGVLTIPKTAIIAISNPGPSATGSIVLYSEVVGGDVKLYAKGPDGVACEICTFVNTATPHVNKLTLNWIE